MQFYKVQKQRLEPDEVKAFIDRFTSEELHKLIAKEQYFLGNNPFIENRKNDVSNGAPDWRIKISYARKIINTVAGYLYKPGNIKYTFKNKTNPVIDDLFTRNKEIIKTSQIGKIVSAFGFGYEIFFADEKANPMWAIADVKEVIPLYTDELDSKLFAFIRFVKKTEGKEEVIIADVYYVDIIEHYKIYNGNNKRIIKLEDSKNIYVKSDMPPLNVIINNEELLGDFDCVTDASFGGLIDAYDVLCSDGMNEEDRFAWAYLLLSDNIAEKDVEKIKQRRIFPNLTEKGFVKFLTKDIPTQFFQFMQEWIRKEIHRQTHIPDFLDMSTGPLTGAALDRLLYDFEFLCATKETYFKEGLLNRFKLIDGIKNISDSEFISQDIEIVMQRNRPSDNLANGQIMQLYTGRVTEKTLLENFAPFVKDVDQELKDLEAKAEEDMEKFAEQNEMFSPADTGEEDIEGENNEQV